jgi:hypothetical protein
MKDKSNRSPSFVKMEQARRLMDQGHFEESLVLALDALLEELDHLRDSLQSLQAMPRWESPALAPDIPEDPHQPDFSWLPPTKPRILH